MSRNLSEVTCVHCGSYPKLTEEPREIKEEEARVYFDEYRGLLVANAECPDCSAKYLAWVDDRGCTHWPTGWGRRWADPRSPRTHFDLSYRSSFDDEPGLEDLPLYETKTKVVRVGPYTKDPYLNFYKSYRPDEYAAHIDHVLGNWKKEKP